MANAIPTTALSRGEDKIASATAGLFSRWLEESFEHSAAPTSRTRAIDRPITQKDGSPTSNRASRSTPHRSPDRWTPQANHHNAQTGNAQVNRSGCAEKCLNFHTSTANNCSPPCAISLTRTTKLSMSGSVAQHSAHVIQRDCAAGADAHPRCGFECMAVNDFKGQGKLP